MFGFGYRPDHFSELSVHLVEKWHMRARYATAFVSAYRRNISALHEAGTGGFHGSQMSSPGMLSINSDVDPCDLTLVKQAYSAYMTDLPHGRHLGTDVEIAIWAILASRIDLVRGINSAIAKSVEDHWELLFPDLFELAFTEFRPSCPLSLYQSAESPDYASGVSMVRPELGFLDMTAGGHPLPQLAQSS
jgi:hypothetical protein